MMILCTLKWFTATLVAAVFAAAGGGAAFGLSGGRGVGRSALLFIELAAIIALVVWSGRHYHDGAHDVLMVLCSTKWFIGSVMVAVWAAASSGVVYGLSGNRSHTRSIALFVELAAIVVLTAGVTWFHCGAEAAVI